MLAPLLAALILAVPIWCDGYGPSTWSYTAAGVREWVEAFRIPIYTAAIAIPFTGIAVAIHRSAQTANQIALQQSQTFFQNFYTHRREFLAHANDGRTHEQRLSQDRSVRPMLAHHAVWPNLREGDPAASAELLVEFKKMALSIFEFKEAMQGVCNRVDKDRPQSWDNFLLAMNDEVKDCVQNALYSIDRLHKISQGPRKQTKKQFEHELNVFHDRLSQWRSLIMFDTSERAMSMEDALHNMVSDTRKIIKLGDSANVLFNCAYWEIRDFSVQTFEKPPQWLSSDQQSAI